MTKRVGMITGIVLAGVLGLLVWQSPGQREPAFEGRVGWKGMCPRQQPIRRIIRRGGRKPMEILVQLTGNRQNQTVLRHVQGLSAHSDVADALIGALKPLGDVQLFCPDPRTYRYLVAATKEVIFAVALGMNVIGFRLDEPMKARAVASGGVLFPECGAEWVSFTLFRADWPKVDLEFWARKAYVAARESQA